MSRGIYKIFTYSLSCHHLCLFQGFSGTECVADFVAHGEIGVVDRVEGDWFQFFRVDLSVGQSAQTFTISPTRMPLSKLFTLHSSAIGSSSISGALTNSLFVAWKPARANLSGTFLPDSMPT